MTASKSRARSLSTATLFAMLERRGYRVSAIGDLTRAYIAAVLQHEVNDKGDLVPRYSGPPLDERERDPGWHRRQTLRKFKLPEHLIDKAICGG